MNALRLLAVPLPSVPRTLPELLPVRFQGLETAPVAILASGADASKATKPGLKGRFQAGIAEFLLVTRLRARRPVKGSVQSADVIANGAAIVQVTCKDWFGSAAGENASKSQGHYRTRI